MDRQQLQENPKINEIRMISEQNLRTVNSVGGYSHIHSRQRDAGEEREFHSHFLLRLLLCIGLFSGYCFLEKEDRIIGTYDSVRIQELIAGDFKAAPYLEQLREHETIAAFLERVQP